MTGRARLALVGLAVVVAVAALLIAKPGSSSKHAGRAGQAGGQTTGPAGQTTGAATITSVVISHIVVRDGKPVGGVRTITVKEGQEVRFQVTSDIAEEVHVHGYDLHKDVAAGGAVSFAFRASISGVFVIELEARGEQIASLKVEP